MLLFFFCIDSGWGWGTSTADGSGWGGSSTDSSSWSWGAAEQVSHSFSGSTEPDYNIECELFNSSNVQAVGINFDKVFILYAFIMGK